MKGEKRNLPFRHDAVVEVDVKLEPFVLTLLAWDEFPYNSIIFIVVTCPLVISPTILVARTVAVPNAGAVVREYFCCWELSMTCR